MSLKNERICRQRNAMEKGRGGESRREETLGRCYDGLDHEKTLVIFTGGANGAPRPGPKGIKRQTEGTARGIYELEANVTWEGTFSFSKRHLE